MQVVDFSEELIEKFKAKMKETDELKEWWRTIPE